jgi:hypothetical protein
MNNGDNAAFPRQYSESNQCDIVTRYQALHGLTKREYFAALIMAGMNTPPYHDVDYRVEVKDGASFAKDLAVRSARAAVFHADALIAELEKPK